MKKIGIYSMMLLMLGISTMSTGCMGSWALSKKLYKWNESATSSKFVNQFIFWALVIIPVYPICFGVIDYWILNLVEFWTGSNPIAMAPGEKEQQTVKGNDGNMYEITATQNRFDIVQLTGDKKGTVQSMVFSPSTQTCSVIINGVETKLVQYNEKTNMMELFRPDGSSVSVDANTSPDMAMEMLKTDAVFASK
jgi:hypothetical protein